MFPYGNIDLLFFYYYFLGARNSYLRKCNIKDWRYFTCNRFHKLFHLLVEFWSNSLILLSVWSNIRTFKNKLPRLIRFPIALSDFFLDFQKIDKFTISGIWIDCVINIDWAVIYYLALRASMTVHSMAMNRSSLGLASKEKAAIRDIGLWSAWQWIEKRDTLAIFVVEAVQRNCVTSPKDDASALDGCPLSLPLKKMFICFFCSKARTSLNC